MKLVHLALAAYALALGAAHALTIDASNVAPPTDIVGEHQTLQRSWTIASLEELEKLVLLVPGRVFIDVAGSVATPTPTTAAPVPTPSATKPVVAVVSRSDDSDGDESRSTSASGSGDDSANTIVVVAPLSASSQSFDSSASDDDEIDASDSDEDIVFPTSKPPAATRARTANATHAPSNTTATHAAAHSPERSSSGSAEAATVSVRELTTTLRRELKSDKDDDDSSDSSDSSDEKTHKKHKKPQEAVVATVVITGNSSALLELIEIVPLHARSQNGIKIHLKNQNAALNGYVLTQITVANKHFVRSVSAHLADAVVIGDRVLVTDDKDTTVKLATAGVSSLFVHSSTDVSLDSLKLDVAGAGLVQLQVPTLKLADALVADVAGAGSVALLANASLSVAQVKAAVSGSGDLIVQTAQLHADELTAAVYGDGSASFASAGNVTNEKLTLSGSGNLLVGSLVAQKAAVSVWGSGDVIVRVTDKLKVTTTFTGSVGYVGAAPARVKTSKWLFWRSDIVHPAGANTVLTHAVVAAPARYPAYASVVVKQVHYSDEPSVTVGTVAQASYLAVVSTQLASVAHGPNGFVVFSMVATTLVVVGLAANSFHKRRVRRHYRPLV